MWSWLAKIGLWLLGKMTQQPVRQPDAEAQDKRADAVAEAARAETANTANQATQEAKEADRAKDDAAAAAVADGRAERVRDPTSVRTSPDAHFRD